MGRAIRWKVQSVNRWVWIARLIGIGMLIVFVVLMITLQRKLTTIRENQTTTTTSTSR
jgi:uncharacterized membrane protein